MKIFVVEDDIVCVKELQTMIKDLGFELMGAAVNVEDCSRFLKYKTPDLVIAKIDIGIDGLSFLLNNDKVQSIPTIFTTGANGSKELAKQGHINNCTTLVKPFDKDTLLSAIIYLKTKQNDTNLARLILAKKKLINRPIKQDDVKEISAILKEDATLTSFNLSDREKYILKKYCLELSSFGEIGDSLKISPQRVRILYKKAFVKVKSSLSNLAIKEDKKATVKFKADKPTLENSLPMGFSEKKEKNNYNIH